MMNKVSKVASASLLAFSLALSGATIASASSPSAEVRATTSAKAKITTQPKSTSVATGKVAKFTVKAKGSGLKYQWYSKKAGSSKWIKASGSTAKKATYKVKASTKNSGSQFRVIVSNKSGKATSKSVKLTVQTKPKVTTQPKSLSAKIGTSKTLSVKAKGNSLKYQWQQKASSGWSNISGAKKSSYKFSVKSGTTTYRVIVSNAAGKTASAQAAVTGVSTPKISKQPESSSVYIDESTTLSVTATGGALKYQWEKYDSQSETWQKVNGANSAKLTVKGTKNSQSGEYRVKVSNALGTATSTSAYVVVFSSEDAAFAADTAVVATDYGFIFSTTETYDDEEYGVTAAVAEVFFCYFNEDYLGYPDSDLALRYFGTDGYYYDNAGAYLPGDLSDTGVYIDGECDYFYATAIVPTEAVYGGSWYIWDKYGTAPFDELYIEGAKSPIAQ